MSNQSPHMDRTLHIFHKSDVIFDIIKPIAVRRVCNRKRLENISHKCIVSWFFSGRGHNGQPAVPADFHGNALIQLILSRIICSSGQI